MTIEVLKSRISKPLISGYDKTLHGSIIIGEDLLDAFNIVQYEKIKIISCINGLNKDLIVFAKEGSDIILPNTIKSYGKNIILLSYMRMNAESAASHKPINI